MIDETVRNIVEDELREGEVLLWAGRPRIINLLPFAFVTLILGVLLIAMVIPFAKAFFYQDPSHASGIIVNGVEITADTSMHIIQTTFWLSASLITVSYIGFFYSILHQFKSVYAITDERIIFKSLLFPTKVFSKVPVFGDDLIRKGSNNLGQLIIFPSKSVSKHLLKRFLPNNHLHLLNIKKPKDVEKIIYQTFLKKDSAP
ncbi:hypothetical protein [Litorimonas sp.]|uniref:hypothetical protein n=1 Tax=Litorimonas sp. TaxID=1892381 RepID=UPI003A89FFC7